MDFFFDAFFNFSNLMISFRANAFPIVSPKLKNILLNNWTLAIVISLLVILIFHPVKNKFLVKLEKSQLITSNTKLYFSDLDNDGFSEKILLENNQTGNGDVKIYNPQIVGQFNSETPLPQANPNAIFDDCNNDGIQEIYFSGLRNDSLFINQVDYSDLKNPKEYFIEKLAANADFAVNISQTADLNNDGFKEILLAINAGFSLQPRKIYALNLQNKQILKTPCSGAKINNQNGLDIDNDGFLDILSGTFASRNYNEPDIAYTDQYSWVMAFDHNLNFKFEPIKTSEQKTSSNIIPFEKNNQKLKKRSEDN